MNGWGTAIYAFAQQFDTVDCDITINNMTNNDTVLSSAMHTHVHVHYRQQPYYTML